MRMIEIDGSTERIFTIEFFRIKFPLTSMMTSIPIGHTHNNYNGDFDDDYYNNLMLQYKIISFLINICMGYNKCSII